MRLKPAGILVIVLIIAILGYFALKPRLSNIRAENGTELPGTTTNRNTSESGNAANAPEPTTPAATGNTEDREFNYTPEKPQNGTMRGVVEVGATGFNSFVINMDAQKRWEIVSKDFGE